MSTSTFSPLAFLSDDSDKGRRRRMMMAAMLSQGGNQEAPLSPFAGAMQGLTSGIGNGLMIAELGRDAGWWGQSEGTANPSAVRTTPGIYGSSAATEQGRIPGQDFGTAASVHPAQDSFWNGGSYGDMNKTGSSASPLWDNIGQGFNNLGSGIANAGYGIGNWFGGLW